MKKQLIKMSLAAFVIGCTMNSAKAQWQPTGNAVSGAANALGTTNNRSLRVVTNNVQRMVVDSLGRLGIGIAAPPNVLSVKGSGGTPAAVWVSAGAPLFTGFGEQTVGNADYILSMASSLANARPVFIGRRSKGTLAAPLTVASNDNIMSFLSSAYDGTAFQNPAAIDFFVDGTPAAGSVPARISFVTGSNSSNRAERLRIGANGNIFFNTTQFSLDNATGNVGIGTSTPNYKFHVIGSTLTTGNAIVNASILIDATNSNNGNLTTGGSIRFGDVLSGEGILSKRTTGGNQFGIDFLTNSQSRLSITNSGNVGIGSTLPAAKLDVNGDALINGLTIGKGGGNKENTVIGKDALKYNFNGIGNTAAGEYSLTSNNNGNQNTAIGKMALFANYGSYNTALGSEALAFNNVGNYNTACGFNALQFNGDAEKNTAIGSMALYSNNTGSYNAAVGAEALYFNTSGYFNTANGFYALNKTTTGDRNTSSGSYSMFNNTTGTRNSAFGVDALLNNTSGNTNVAAGFEALHDNTAGFSNVAIGVEALYKNTVRSNLVAIGDSALYKNGLGASFFEEGAGNTAIGSKALMNNTLGKTCTASGIQALYNNTTGIQNTAVGAYAMEFNTSGYFNAAFGMVADMSANNLFNATAIGAGSLVNGNNKVRIGNATVTIVESQAGSWTTSDGRFKTNVREEVKGLEFINLLRPVVYNFDTRKYENFVMQNYTEEQRNFRMKGLKQAYESSAAIRRSGFIAQEVLEAAKKAGYDFGGVHLPENPTDNYSLSYENFTVPLVKAVQELSIKNEELKIKNEDQQKVNEDLKKEANNTKADLQKQIDELKDALLKLATQKTPCTTSK